MSSYTYKFRLYPNQSQEVLLAKHFGCCRFVYNYYLNQRVESYLNNQKSLNYYDNANDIVQLKKEKTWLTEVNAQSLQYSLKCLDGAYGKFFCKVAKFPRFKSRKSKQSFCVPQRAKVIDNKLIIGKFTEGIKAKFHRKIEGQIKHVTVSKNPSGQYHACICVEREIEKLPAKTKQVGIDLGLKALATQSDGKTYRNIKPYRTLEKRLVRLQRWFSKTTKGTSLHEKVRIKIAKLYQKISNIRNDHLQKVSRQIIDENQVICLETLNIKGMLGNHKLAKSVADVSLAELVRMIKYKAAWYGREVFQIDRWFPSSKTCECCNYIKQDLTLADREWTCPRCGLVHDRDVNAARNILKQGLVLRTVGTTGIAWGVENKTQAVKSRRRHTTMKQEIVAL